MKTLILSSSELEEFVKGLPNADALLQLTDAELAAHIEAIEKVSNELVDGYDKFELPIAAEAGVIAGISDALLNVLEDIEFGLGTATNLVVVNETFTALATGKQKYMTPSQFKQTVKVLNEAKYRGIEKARILDQLSSLLEGVAKINHNYDMLYRHIAEHFETAKSIEESRSAGSTIEKEECVDTVKQAAE